MNTNIAGGATAPRVAVSVVTHNNEGCLVAFLDALRGQRGSEWEAFFFDSASSDETLALLTAASTGEIHAHATNIGYGRGHNHNIGRSGTEYVLILNADLEFGPDMIARLVHHMDTHPAEAIAGPAILEGESKTLFPPRMFYPGEGMIPLEKGLRRREIAWINGCCMIVRRSAIESLGGFDADYFLYQAETDLCLRARRAGFTIGHAADVVVNHLHRQSQRDITEYAYGRKIFEGSAVFWRKHYSPGDFARMVRFQYWMSRLLLALGKPLALLPSMSHVLRSDRLRARRDVCADLLSMQAKGREPRAVPGRIVTRQSRVALEWLIRGRFPLDDY